MPTNANKKRTNKLQKVQKSAKIAQKVPTICANLFLLVVLVLLCTHGKKFSVCRIFFPSFEFSTEAVTSIGLV